MRILAASPVLPCLDLEKTLAFYTTKMGFAIAAKFENYALVQRERVLLHFWVCTDKNLCEKSSCYIYTDSIEELYDEFSRQNVIHPNGRLETKPYGMKEFAALDIDGNLLRFGEEIIE